ncbi:hypothetical protein [Burkholderia pyrrocinia]|nr:hypothetical protein [Burkholderia pyrrocinia]
MKSLHLIVDISGVDPVRLARQLTTPSTIESIFIVDYSNSNSNQ